jgi:hypothetical protein
LEKIKEKFPRSIIERPFIVTKAEFYSDSEIFKRELIKFSNGENIKFIFEALLAKELII